MSIFNNHHCIENATTFLSGTLHTAKMDMDMLRAKDIKYAAIGTPPFKRPENATEEQWVVSIMKDVDYNPEIMKQRIANKIRMESGKAHSYYFLSVSQTHLYARVEQVFSAYEDDRMFSVALVGAVCSIHSLFRVLFHSVNLSGHTSRVVHSENGSVALDEA